MTTLNQISAWELYEYIESLFPSELVRIKDKKYIALNISFQNNEITLYKDGKHGDTFIGEVAHIFLHTFNKCKFDTFMKRFLYFNDRVKPIIAKKTGIVYLWLKN